MSGHATTCSHRRSFTDRWFDTLEDARAELTTRLDGLAATRTRHPE